jgi:hypothetical protein
MSWAIFALAANLSSINNNSQWNTLTFMMWLNCRTIRKYVNCHLFISSSSALLRDLLPINFTWRSRKRYKKTTREEIKTRTYLNEIQNAKRLNFFYSSVYSIAMSNLHFFCILNSSRSSRENWVLIYEKQFVIFLFYEVQKKIH